MESAVDSENNVVNKCDTNQPIFRALTADDPETTEIESLCMNCSENGTTRILLTKIPFYKEVILMSFECENCGFRNCEIQSGAKVDEKGIRIIIHVNTVDDLNRQVVKSDNTSIRIPQLDFEIPAQSQRAEITTIEGVIDRSITSLQQDQRTRQIEDPTAAAQIDAFLVKLKILKDVQEPFIMILEDISGNSFVENPYAPHKDLGTETRRFIRSAKQDHVLGIYTSDEVKEKASEHVGLLQPLNEGDFTLDDLQGEVLQIVGNCSECGASCPTNIKVTNIPYFKEVLIMATNCDGCGHRTSEVKSGSGIEPKGVRIEVQVRKPEDFSRDVLKSDTCSLMVPELDLEVGSFALGGRFTTVEGLLVAMKDQLTEQGSMFQDSADVNTNNRFSNFFIELNKVLSGELFVSLVLDDPAGNSYVQSLTDQGKDPSLNITSYERTYEQNEILGLNDMKTEGYEELQ